MRRPEPIDPDPVPVGAAAVLAVSIGGGLGSVARLAVDVVVPGVGAALAVNLLGCALIGGLVVLVTERNVPRLTRPFLGTGFLGGFTTFSAYALDVETLWNEGARVLAAGYLAGTVAGCLAATALAMLLARRFVAPGRDR